MATEIRFVQQVRDPDAAAHAAHGVAPDGVFIRAADGTEVDATQPVNAVIEIQQQSQSGSTFLLGHELAHNLLDVLRRTGTLTPEMDAALTGRFKDKDGAFDEEAFADAFGAELRDAFTLQEEERIANAPKTKVGRILRALADTVRGWAHAAFAFRRAQENAQTAQANAPASVLEAFLKRQGEAQEGNRSESPNSSAQGAKYHIPNPTGRFSETDAGKRVVAEVLDALIETNPAFVFDRERAVDAKASASEGSRERLNKARERLDGIKAGLTAEQWQDVLGTAFEVSGRFDVLGETNGVISPMVRERMAAYLQDIVRNRATMLGRRA